MDKSFVTFEGGVSRHGEHGVNYMMTSVETGDGLVELYAEIRLPDDVEDENGDRVSPVSEDYGYMALKRAILELAERYDITPEMLKFWYDGQEETLEDDAHVTISAVTEIRDI